MNSNPTPDLDFDGCNSECRRAGAHTLRWGGCERAPEPEPTVSLSRVYTDVDGDRSIGFDTYTVPQLAELIMSGLRASDLAVNADDFAEICCVAAQAIVHRNNPAARPAVPSVSAVGQTTRDRIAEAIHRDLLAHRVRRDQGLLGIVPRLTDAVLAVLPPPADRAALERVRAVLETEHVVGRTALEYRGLITSALMADEPKQDGAQR